jgi:hypothetical protein
MRHFLLLVAVCSALTFFSCDKDDDVTKQNYIQANIGNELFKCYEDNKLNKDTVLNTFTFTFGQNVLTSGTQKDTALFFNVSLNRHNLAIKFPKTNKAQTYTIYRSSIAGNPASGYYAVVPKVAPEEGLRSFTTLDMTNEVAADDKKVGEVKVTRFDSKARIIEGTFQFTAFQYLMKGETIKAGTDSVAVTKGEFYYHWGSDLKI